MTIRTDPVRRALTAGTWSLPVSTALLAVGTLTHQPALATADADTGRQATHAEARELAKVP
ncbi:hypothetical protein ACI79C_13285 [Geodermatophilus sp. SYSU D00697]